MRRLNCLMSALLVVVAASVPATAAAQSNVAGDWEITITSPLGTRTTAISLKQEGEKLTGMFKSQAGELPVEGSLTGSDLKLAFTINFQGQPMPVTMTGSVDGASIKGKTDYGGLAEGEFSATRAGTATAADSPSAAVKTPDSPAPATAATIGAAGTWDVMLKTQSGEFPITASLVDEAGKITGTVMTHLGELPVEGTIEGHTLKLTLVAKTPQGDIPVALTGDIDGDAIVNGKAEIGGMGQGEWTARRKP
jgi:hypothetical protein